MIKWTIRLAILAALLGVADFGAKTYAEGKIASQVEAAVEGEQDADADIESFPFLGWLLLNGTVGDITVSVDAVPVGPLTFDRLVLELEGVQVDRDLLFQQEVELEEIDGGRLGLQIDRPIALGRVPIPRTPLVPCDAEATAQGEAIVISCTFEEVPEVFIRAANEATLPGAE